MRLKPIALVLVLACAGFVLTGCYHDPYYGRGRVHTGVYATYGTPGPYYYGDPYGYGYSRGYVGPRYRTSSITVGTGYYSTRPRYHRRGYRGGYRSGYRSGYRRSGGYVRRGDWRRARSERRGRTGNVRRDRSRSRVRAEVQTE